MCPCFGGVPSFFFVQGPKAGLEAHQVTSSQPGSGDFGLPGGRFPSSSQESRSRPGVLFVVRQNLQPALGSHRRTRKGSWLLTPTGCSSLCFSACGSEPLGLSTSSVGPLQAEPSFRGASRRRATCAWCAARARRRSWCLWCLGSDGWICCST